jgi:uncharacterized membrane protein YdjX (TVP38/TMEM64 family)
MLIVGSALGVAVDIVLFVVCLLIGIGALQVALQLSPHQQRRTRQDDPSGGWSPVWSVVAFRMLYTVVGLVFLAIPVLTIAGVIPWD